MENKGAEVAGSRQLLVPLFGVGIGQVNLGFVIHAILTYLARHPR